MNWRVFIGCIGLIIAFMEYVAFSVIDTRWSTAKMIVALMLLVIALFTAAASFGYMCGG